jgi:hypothetical protein
MYGCRLHFIAWMINVIGMLSMDNVFPIENNVHCESLSLYVCVWKILASDDIILESRIV